ncbi:MAG: cobalamin-dependent protein [Candidatus Aureabacteria bacterium]|nr:cobalamin-dependent protein [Candidatus Auribacterota bacterium]
MKILLLQPRFTYSRYMQIAVEMPLGLCSLAAVARQRGHTVVIVDCLAEGFANAVREGDLTTYGLPDEEIERRINEFHPDLVGVSCLFSAQYGNARRLCELTKRVAPRAITVMGGMHPTVKPREVLSEESVDFIFQGESDITFSDFADALERGDGYGDIDGLGYKRDGVLVINRKEHFIADLDALPFPARDLLKVDCYYRAARAHDFVLTHSKNMNLITSRGCPARCIFCTIFLVWGRRFRARSPENVLAELEQMKRDFGVRHVQFEDDNLTYDIGRAKRIFRGMIDRRLGLAWNTPNGVALWSLDEEALDLMKRAGCYYVKFAIESGNQRVLSRVIKKPQDLARARRLIEYARSLGMMVGSFFVVGLPGETREEMQDSFDFRYTTRLDYTVYIAAKPEHGTELRRLCEEKGYLRKHTDLELEGGEGFIETPEFTPEWLRNKIARENKRYLRFLITHQPGTLLSLGWLIFKRDPLIVVKHLAHTLGLTR